MKKMTSAGLALAAVSAVLTLLSCARQEVNNSIAKGSPTPTSSASPSASPTPWPNICTTIQSTDPSKVEKAIQDAIDSSGLKGQYGKQAFKFKVKQDPNNQALYMMIEGNMGHLFLLPDILGKTVVPSCLKAVYFVKKGTIQKNEPISAELNSDDFFWFGCDYPQEPCDGMCVDPGTCHLKADAKTSDQ